MSSYECCDEIVDQNIPAKHAWNIPTTSIDDGLLLTRKVHSAIETIHSIGRFMVDMSNQKLTQTYSYSSGYSSTPPPRHLRTAKTKTKTRTRTCSRRKLRERQKCKRSASRNHEHMPWAHAQWLMFHVQ